MHEGERMKVSILKSDILSIFLMVLVIGLSAIGLHSQQINISRIEMMPNLPEPYRMRDWRQVTTDYDNYIFDFTKTGLYLPLIWWNVNTINYPGHVSFGLHTVVGTTSPSSAEAINVLPAVVSASLAGIDKSNQNGQNWVLMCEEYFNKANGANVYLNHPDGSNWDDWWYDTMPNLFFFQLYDVYRHTGDFDLQFTTVADRWLSAVAAMGGSATPWHVPNMNYRAFNLITMMPYSGGVREPEAAGAIAWLLYNAYTETGDSKYRVGAEWAMEFLDNWSTNPSYELQLPYGAFVAARMNAELGTEYDITKLVNWCFTTTGNVRNWGAIVGNWGGYECSGLIGEVSSNDYAFMMNTFEQAGALVPLVRYDSRFARAIGKWMLNAANAARLLYSNYLPDENQDSESWAHPYDSTSVIAYEALHEYDPHNPNAAPFATGDAVTGGWGHTNLSLYGSSHLGIFGGIIDTTDVKRILRLDATKTNYFSPGSYSTYLIFNPYAADSIIAFDVGSGSHDIYDAVSHSFLQTNITGSTSLVVPADAAILAVITPAGGPVTYHLDKMLVNGIVVDYHSGHFTGNYPPRIKSLAADSSTVLFGQSTTLFCMAEDRDNDPLTYTWSAGGGTINGDSSQVSWTAPALPGTYAIRVIVEDSEAGRDSANIDITVVESINHAPVIEAVTAHPRKIDLGAGTHLACIASDPDGDSLSYTWSAAAGTLSDSGATAAWIAPLVEGNYYIICTVDDSAGGQAIDSIGIVVRDFSNTQTGSLVAFYPFNGNANDESGNGHYGTVSGAVLTEDRFGNPNSAYYFDGLNDYIRIPNHDSLNFQHAVTINYWMRIGQLFNREAFPISHGSWENRWKVSLIPGDQLRWTVKTSTGIKDLDTETRMVTDTWYNVTVYYSGADFEIYIDGELNSFSSMSGLISSTTYDLTIGQRLPNDPNYNFKGVLDDIRIYNYGLSVQQIEDLYSSGTPIKDNGLLNIPEDFMLFQNYPNPFNPVTRIEYALPKASDVVIDIYSILGQRVATLFKGRKPAGYHIVEFDAGRLSSGLYVYRVRAGEYQDARKMLLLK